MQENRTEDQNSAEQQSSEKHKSWSVFIKWAKIHPIVAFLLLSITVAALATGILTIHRSVKFPVDKTSWIKMEPLAETGNLVAAPGDEFQLAEMKLKVNSTSESYGFFKVTCPVLGDDPIYTVTPGTGWKRVEGVGSAGEQVFAYASGGDGTLELTTIDYQGETSRLITSMKLIEMDNATYAGLNSIDFEVDGYLIEKDGAGSTDPADVWNKVKDTPISR